MQHKYWNTDDTYVYESPDSGETVYRRKIGAAADTRELVRETLESAHNIRQQRRRWDNIIENSKSDEELRALIERVEIYHRLKYE